MSVEINLKESTTPEESNVLKILNDMKPFIFDLSEVVVGISSFVQTCDACLFVRKTSGIGLKYISRWYKTQTAI
ncbi:hypothetical protein SDC9_58583 [bioreactor metagenome]|uniref:Uncharacterized protein n=1 Tax=bioreactor metagenome TaxID=1076179 RepID=A0A644X8U1_9ZZZZ